MNTRPIWFAFWLALISSIVIPESLDADVLANDTFRYSNGKTLYGQNGGTGSGMVTQGGRAVGSNFGYLPLFGKRSGSAYFEFGNGGRGSSNIVATAKSIWQTA